MPWIIRNFTASRNRKKEKKKDIWGEDKVNEVLSFILFVA